jgi:hypothetical protein
MTDRIPKHGRPRRRYTLADVASICEILGLGLELARQMAHAL